MKTLYFISLVIFAGFAGIFFMLVKTWLMNQIIFIREGKYIQRPKDRIWNKPGWVAVLVFCILCIWFHLLLILDFKLSQ